MFFGLVFNFLGFSRELILIEVLLDILEFGCLVFVLGLEMFILLFFVLLFEFFWINCDGIGGGNLYFFVIGKLGLWGICGGVFLEELLGFWEGIIVCVFMEEVEGVFVGGGGGGLLLWCIVFCGKKKRFYVN